MTNYQIDVCSNLQRIKKAADAEKELEYQIALVRAKLESCGIVTENLDMK